MNLALILLYFRLKSMETIVLNNGIEIPKIGLGVFKSTAGEETFNAVLTALKAGYRHIDTATIYRNEHSVGDAIRESGISRDKIFITTKLWNADQGYETTFKAFNKSLDNLKVEYIDLYLLHWPVEGRRLQSWKALEKLYKEGMVRAIGVSNFMKRHLIELLEHSEILPAINQIELHPFNYWYFKEIVDICKLNGIALEAYSPLTKGQRLYYKPLVDMSVKYGKSTAQLLIRWGLQKNFIVLPKSVNNERIEANINVFDFVIIEEDILIMDSFNENLITGWNPVNQM